MGDIVRNAATEPEMWDLAALAKLAAGCRGHGGMTRPYSAATAQQHAAMPNQQALGEDSAEASCRHCRHGQTVMRCWPDCEGATSSP